MVILFLVYGGADERTEDFFQKCLAGTLDETDFDFAKFGQNEKVVKGSVRRKKKNKKHNRRYKV